MVEDIEMATKKKTAKDDGHEDGKQIGVRLSLDEWRRLERLAAHLSVSTIARVAMRIGLDVIEAQPGVLLGETPRPPKR